MLVKKLDLSLQAKTNAILSQIRAAGVTNQNILKAFKIVDRLDFMPTGFSALAYSDNYIECESGRAMLSMQSVARVLQFLEPKPEDKTLLVGGNYGYLAAVLSVMGLKPYVVESSSNLVAKCHEKLNKYQIANFSNTPLHLGMISYAPFNLIIMEVGCNYIPKDLVDQLIEDGK
jgi:protein-L-isoaspartate(D-aspartate) O-methyltransferase